MPPCQRLGGDGAMPPPPWDEDDEDEVFGDEAFDEEEFDADEEEEDDDDDDDDEAVPIAGLHDLASVVDRPDDFPGRHRVCILGVLFREAPLLLESLHEADAAGVGILLVGNLDRLRRAGQLHAGLARLSGSLKTLRARVDGCGDPPPLLPALRTDGNRRALEDDVPPLLLPALGADGARASDLPVARDDDAPRLPALDVDEAVLRRALEDETHLLPARGTDDAQRLPALDVDEPVLRRALEDETHLLPARGTDDAPRLPALDVDEPVLRRALEDETHLLPARGTDDAPIIDMPVVRDPPLLPALGVDEPVLLLAALGTGWPDLRRALEDEVPLLSALCEEQPESLRGRVLLLLEHLKTVLGGLPDPARLDNANGDPKPSTAALAATVARILDDAEALLHGGVHLDYPGADAATFVPLRIIRVEGQQHLGTILAEPHHYMLQSDFSIVQLQFHDAQRMFNDTQKAAEDHGWWFGNQDRLEQARNLHRCLSRISQSLKHLGLQLETDGEVDWGEIQRIRSAAPELPNLCNLQPENLSSQVFAINQGITALLQEALPHKQDDADFPPNLIANLAAQVTQLEEAVKGIWGTTIEYPEVTTH